MERYTVLKRSGAIAAVGAAVILRELEPHIADRGDRFDVRLPGPTIHLNGSRFRCLPNLWKPPAKLRFAGLPASLMSKGISSEEAERAAD
jgi:hypothetical protein